MRKVFILLLLTIIVGLSVLVAYCDDTMIPNSELLKDSSIETLLQEQAAAKNAYKQIIDSLPKDSNNNPVFPDCYGGAYYKDKRLHINITPNGYIIKKQFAEVVDDSKLLVYHEVEYSYNFLLYIEQLLCDTLDQQTVSYICIDEIHNMLEIGINPNAPFYNSMLEDEILAVFEKEILIVLNKAGIDYSNDNSLFLLKLSTPPQCATNLIGGDKIWPVGYSTSWFSLGICGTYFNGSSSVPAVLTCGHGNQSLGNNIIFNNGLYLGPVTIRQFASSEYYDYSIVTLTNTSNFSTTNQVYSSLSTISITGTTTYHLIGTYVFKYGAKNYYGLGTISNSAYVANYSENMGTNFYVYGLIKVDNVSGCVLPGDSGGPVFSGSVFYGTISGCDTSDAHEYYIYSPITGVNSAFSILTN